MRHLNNKPHLNRTASHRRALFSNMSASLFLHRKITTTLGRAKHARKFAERMITFARKGDVAARRHVIRFLRDKEAVRKLFDELGPHFKNRNGGYTRIIKLGPRRGDAAPMALLELVGFDDATTEKSKKKTSKSKLQPKATAAKKVKAEKLAVKAADEAKVEETVVDPEVKEEVEVAAAEETTEELKVEEAPADPEDKVEKKDDES